MILKEIEQEFLETIHNNRRHSNKNIIEFFDEIETHTKNSLEQLDDDLKEDVKNIYAGFEKIEKEVKEVNRILLLYRGSINEMDDEIKKRDAIIERKTNQLKRIKNEI